MDFLSIVAEALHRVRVQGRIPADGRVQMFSTPTTVAFTTALFLAAAPSLSLAYDSPAQMAHDQAVCNERFAGQDLNKTRQEREDCVHRERLDRKDRADRAELHAKDRADRERYR
jgi:hypothetical protein